MGRAVVALIDRELISVFGDSSGFESPVFRQRAEEELAYEERRSRAGNVKWRRRSSV
jgi:hypothetical protein